MSNAEFFRAVQTWAAEHYPGLVHRMRLTVELHGGSKVSLTVPSPAAKVDDPGFVPNEKQVAILEVLEGKALRTKEIERESGYTSAEIFRAKGGMQELRAAGMVSHGPGGFFRTDAPPEKSDS